MKPLIGITCDYGYLNTPDLVKIYGPLGMAKIVEDYYQGVEKAGGIPVIIPIIEKENIGQLLDKLDGIILSGGADLNPLFYNEDPIRDLSLVIPQRDECEINIAKESLKKHLPIFAICRGLQVLNVAMGGTLYQDIDNQLKDNNIIKHRQLAPRWHASHKVLVNEDTKLMNIMSKKELYVNSYHHQAIKNLAEGLRVNAYSNDNIIEGVEGIGEDFILGVQWHPENMWKKHSDFLNLFKALIEAAH